MESGSYSSPIFIAKPIVVEVKDIPRPTFKWYPHVATKEDSVGAFSHVPERVVYVEDVRAYIHCHTEDLGTLEIKGMYMNELVGEFGKIKLAY